MTRFFSIRPDLRHAVAGGIASILLGPVAVQAMAPLDIPATARETWHDVSAMDSYALPVGAFDGLTVPSRPVEGRVARHVWKIGGSAASTLQVLAPLRDQLVAAGYDILFECADRDCGGFDFRFGIEVAAEPDMHVDLGDYRFLAAGMADTHLSLLVSRSADAVYVQLVQVDPAAPPEDPPATLSTKLVQPDAAAAQTEFADMLLTEGLAVLDDLVFKTGSSDLEDGDFASLSALAGFLIDHPDTTVLLVGHTDAEGALESNIALSRKRADAVLERLVSDFMIPAERVQTDGVGFLSPRSTNQTEEGRAQNRRVEVVLTSTR